MATQFSTKDNRPWKAPFFTIWIGQIFSLLGSQVVQFALVWYLTKETGSATVLATATLVAILPGVILGPFIGSLVDRLNRKRLIMVSDFSIAVATILLAVLFALGSIEIWHIYALMAFRAIGGAFHGPAFTSSTSLMIPVEHLARIQGVNQMMHGGLNIIAAPFGALLLELMPMQGILMVDVVTAAIAITSVFFTSIPQPDRVSSKADGSENTYWEDFREGFVYVWRWPGLLLILLMATVINFMLNPASALSPLLISEYFGGGASQLAVFEAVFASGVIIGGLALGVWGGFKRHVVTTMVGLIGLGLGMALIGWVPQSGFNIALGGMLLAGLMMPITNGSLGAIFQTAIEPHMQGRVFTLIGSIAGAMSPIGLIFAGPIADRFGVQSWYLVGGLVCSLMGVWGFTNRSVMTVEDEGSKPQIGVSAKQEA